jgi:hypothetical protein
VIGILSSLVGRRLMRKSPLEAAGRLGAALSSAPPGYFQSGLTL